MRAIQSIALLLAALVLATQPVRANVLVHPRVAVAEVEWAWAIAAMAQAPGRPSPTPANRSAPPSQSELDHLATINRALAPAVPWAAASAVPVLLPFDLARFIADGSSAKSATAYLTSGAIEIGPMDAGEAGYEAWIVVPIEGRNRVVFLSASRLLYEADGLARLAAPQPVSTGPGQPAGRSYVIDGSARLAVTRYGVTYVLSLACSTANSRSLDCGRAREALARMAGTLAPVGGRVLANVAPPAAGPVPRPRDTAPAHGFSYHRPGELLPGTGRGKPDPTVYASFQFPLAAAPAFANSQVFKDGGNCLDPRLNLSGDVPGEPFVAPGAAYSCTLAGGQLNNAEGSAANYSYPWRDNFCEQREWEVQQCPGGKGHQGQDIRPATCDPIPWRAAPDRPVALRCRPQLHDAVAIADGVVQRSAGTQLLTLYVNEAAARYRVRYLHLVPSEMDALGIADGRAVRRGERLGRVGNYLDRPFGTTTHLHFELMVPTDAGWLHVNPYASLIFAYEQLIGERGRELPREP